MRSVDDDCIRMWNKGPTDRCNSTRMELLAGVIRLTVPHHLHIKSDSKAVVNKVTAASGPSSAQRKSRATHKIVPALPN